VDILTRPGSRSLPLHSPPFCRTINRLSDGFVVGRSSTVTIVCVFAFCGVTIMADRHPIADTAGNVIAIIPIVQIAQRMHFLDRERSAAGRPSC
jgi:hypothetical protein